MFRVQQVEDGVTDDSFQLTEKGPEQKSAAHSAAPPVATSPMTQLARCSSHQILCAVFSPQPKSSTSPSWLLRPIRLVWMFFFKLLILNSAVRIQEMFFSEDSSMKVIFVVLGLPDLTLTSTPAANRSGFSSFSQSSHLHLLNWSH